MENLNAVLRERIKKVCTEIWDKCIPESDMKRDASNKSWFVDVATTTILELCPEGKKHHVFMEITKELREKSPKYIHLNTDEFCDKFLSEDFIWKLIEPKLIDILAARIPAIIHVLMKTQA